MLKKTGTFPTGSMTRNNRNAAENIDIMTPRPAPDISATQSAVIVL
jgi:hypothetical protein